MTKFNVSLNHGVLRLLLLIALLGGSGWLVYSQQHPQADVVGSSSTSGDTYYSTQALNVAVDESGQITIGDTVVSETVTRLETSDELRVEILNGRKNPVLPGNNVIIELRSDVTLPASASMRAYAIHGAELVDEQPERISDNLARWTLSTMGTESSVSLVVNYAPRSFKLGTRALFNSLPALVSWTEAVLYGGLVWILAIIGMLIVRRPWRRRYAVGVLNAPPSALSAGSAGCLINGRVGPSQLAATLVAMATRGDIQIVQSPAGYRVARRRAIPALSITEQLLLNELRIGLKTITSQEKVEATLSQEVFNHKIAEAYGGLIDELRQRGFFPKDSGRTRVWYRFIALALVLIAIVGAILTTWLIPDGVQLIGFWFGPLLAGWHVFSTMPSLPWLNTVGQQERQRWLEFRRYLTDSRPLGGGQAEARAFLVYLPYAISFDVVPQWLARFNRDLIGIPDWYFNTDNPAASKVFIEDILTISQHIAQDFSRVAVGE